VMKEWVALPANTKKSWLSLAREARDFVDAASSRGAYEHRARRRAPSRGRRAARSARR
jgi:hypothetical protein